MASASAASASASAATARAAGATAASAASAAARGASAELARLLRGRPPALLPRAGAEAPAGGEARAVARGGAAPRRPLRRAPSPDWGPAAPAAARAPGPVERAATGASPRPRPRAEAPAAVPAAVTASIQGSLGFATPLAPQGLASQRPSVGVRALCRTAKELAAAGNEELFDGVWRQAARLARTASEAARVLNSLEARLPADTDVVRALAAKVTQSAAHGAGVRSVCLTANAFARLRLWDQTFADKFVVPLTLPCGLSLRADAGTEAKDRSGFWRACNAADLSQMHRFVTTFQRHLALSGFHLGVFLSHSYEALLATEKAGHSPAFPCLVSLLRGLVRLGPAGASESAVPALGLWLRERLLLGLPLCEPRQLASVLLDLQPLGLLDEDVLEQVRREVDRRWRSRGLRARDLTSIIAGYAKLSLKAQERRDMMQPLVPEMIAALPSCSHADLCELLHGIASVHLRSTTMLAAWASHFQELASSVSPAQLSLVAADLAKVRYVRDSRRTFDGVLAAIAEVAPSLGGLSVCHVVCAMARVSNRPVGEGGPEVQRLLLYRLEAQLLQRVGELLPQGISASAAAFAKVQHYSEELFNGLAVGAVPRLGAFVPEDFAMLSSAIGATHGVLPASTSAWPGEPLEALGHHAAQSLEAAQLAWSPRQVGEVLQPFAILHSKHAPLLHAVEGHFRERANTYAPRDLVRVLRGFRDVGSLGAPQVVSFWGVVHHRLRLFTGLQTLAVAEVMVQHRHGVSEGELRNRFRALAASLRNSLRELPFEGLAAAARLWATAGVRDWPLLCGVAGAAAARLQDASGEVSLQDLSRFLYAYSKLGAPSHAPAGRRLPVYRFLQGALAIFERHEALSSLDALGLRRLVLAVVLWGPPARSSDAAPWAEAASDEAFALTSSAAAAAEEPQAEAEAEAACLPGRRKVLLRGLGALLPQPLLTQLSPPRERAERAGAPAAGRAPRGAGGDAEDQLRLVASSARHEFGILPSELPFAAAARLEALLQEPAAANARSSPWARKALRSYERDVHGALRRLLCEWAAATPAEKAERPPAAAAAAALMHPTPLGCVRLAVPAWRVALEVGCPEDLFGDALRGPRAVEVPSEAWQRFPALRMRLLRRAGWHVVEVPFLEWQDLRDGHDQRQYLRGRLRRARAAALRSGGTPEADRGDTAADTASF